MTRTVFYVNRYVIRITVTNRSISRVCGARIGTRYDRSGNVGKHDDSDQTS